MIQKMGCPPSQKLRRGLVILWPNVAYEWFINSPFLVCLENKPNLGYFQIPTISLNLEGQVDNSFLTKKPHWGTILFMQTVAETRHYSSKAEKLLTQRERELLVMTLAVNPFSGDLIEGAGGLRKMRFAKGGRGKSGGVRAIYYFYNEDVPTVLLDIFGKNEKANLTKAERNSLAAVVTELKCEWRRKRR